MDAIRALLFAVWVAATAGAVAATAVYARFAIELPSVPDFGALEFEGVSTLLAADGQVLAEHYGERRVLLPYERVPRTLLLAITATEDARFFSHSGVDLRGVARAAWRNLRAGAVVEGGSTITQQLAKSFVGDDRSLDRKVREAILARRLEDVYDKSQILLLYLNRIYFGHGSYGVQAAAQNYFRRNVWDLSLGEMALLAGLPQAPSRLNPLVSPDAALDRRAWVLGRMADAGYITDDQAAVAAAEPLRVYPLLDDRADKAPGFAARVRRWLRERYGAGWAQQRLTVHTTADIEHSIEAERAVQEGLHVLDRRQGYRGPLAHLSDLEQWPALLRRARVERRGRALSPGDLAVGVVTEVGPDGLRVGLDPDVAGFIAREALSWAGEYSEFPTDPRTGERDRSGKVSHEPRLADHQARFRPGDVVLVRVRAPASAREERLQRLPRPLSQGLPLELEQLPQVEGALLARDLHTGALVAAVGAYDYDRSEFDRTTAPRQTGSTMKPLAYSLAYREGLPPSRVISGAPVDIDGYRPTGTRTVPDRTAWDGLVTSENSVTLRVYQYALERAGAGGWAAWGRALGLGRALHGYPSEVLGTDQTLTDMSHAFAALASEGRPERLRFVRKVVDDEGRVRWRDLHVADAASSTRDTLDALYDALLPTPEPVIPPAVAYVTAANLADAVKRGTGRRASRGLDFEVAGKTGTLPYDVWFIGFSERHLAGVWVGADRRERVLGESERRNRISGADTALPIWIDWMRGAHRGQRPGPVVGPAPAGVRVVGIDPETGLLARSGGLRIPHLEGTEPTRTSGADAAATPTWTGDEAFDF